MDWPSSPLHIQSPELVRYLAQAYYSWREYHTPRRTLHLLPQIPSALPLLVVTAVCLDTQDRHVGLSSSHSSYSSHHPLPKPCLLLPSLESVLSISTAMTCSEPRHCPLDTRMAPRASRGLPASHPVSSNSTATI